MLFSLQKLSILLGLVAIAAAAPPQQAACQYAEASCDGALPANLKEDTSVPSVNMWKESTNVYKVLLDGGHYVADIHNNQLHLMSSVYTQKNRLRAYEIITTDDQVTYVYIKDNESCLSDVGGNIPKLGAIIKSVKLITLKGWWKSVSRGEGRTRWDKVWIDVEQQSSFLACIQFLT